MGTLSVDKLMKTSTGAAEFTLPATDGTVDQVMKTDGAGQLGFTTVSADPTMGGDLSGLSSNAQIVANAVTTTEIVDDAVTIAKLAATGTADATTFLRGDNAWAAAGGGKVLQVLMGTSSSTVDNTTTTYADTGLTITITPSATTSKILVLANHGTIAKQINTTVHLKLVRDSTDINAWGTGWLEYTNNNDTSGGSGTFTYMDSPSSTSAIVYKTVFKSEGSGSSKKAKVMAGPTDGSIIVLEIGA